MKTLPYKCKDIDQVLANLHNLPTTIKIDDYPVIVSNRELKKLQAEVLKLKNKF